jgi:hypothetical protein
MRRPFTFQGATWLATACFIATLCGCGTSEYNRLATHRLGTARGEAKFRSLFGPTALADTPIKIRVPMVFRTSYREDSAHPIDGPKVHPDRLQPPFLELPGFKICYEGLCNDPSVGRLPYYCYLAAVPGKPGDAENLAKELQAKLREKFKDAPDEWSVVDAETPDGKAVQWKKIRVQGVQPFRFLKDQKMSHDLPGIFELWICEKADYIVMVGWRSPESVQGPPAGPAPTTLVELLAAPRDVKLDLASLPGLTAGTISADETALTDQD